MHQIASNWRVHPSAEVAGESECTGRGLLGKFGKAANRGLYREQGGCVNSTVRNGEGTIGLRG